MGSDTRPVPVSAVWSGGIPGVLTVTFDRPLIPGPTNFGNYAAVHANFLWTFTAAIAAGSTVVLTPVQGGAGSADELLDFDPPPFDLLDAVTFLPVALYHGQPIT